MMDITLMWQPFKGSYSSSHIPLPRPIGPWSSRRSKRSAVAKMAGVREQPSSWPWVKKKGSPVINGINACLVVDLPGSGWLLSADYSLAISVASWCCCPIWNMYIWFLVDQVTGCCMQPFWRFSQLTRWIKNSQCVDTPHFVKKNNSNIQQVSRESSTSWFDSTSTCSDRPMDTDHTSQIFVFLCVFSKSDGTCWSRWPNEKRTWTCLKH